MLKCDREKPRRRLADTVELRRSVSEQNATIRAAQTEAEPESHSEVWISQSWAGLLVASSSGSDSGFG